MCAGRSVGCCRLPFDLSVCPCCSQGIKPSRAWTWVDLGMLLPATGRAPCTGDPLSAASLKLAPTCPLADPPPGTRVGLIWVGTKFYRTPADFMSESAQMGISRRIPAVPKDFVLGETWVLLAHRAGRTEPCEACAELRQKWAKIVSARAAREVAAMGDQSENDPAADERDKKELAAIQATMEDCGPCAGKGMVDIATVFGAFKPSAIERVVDKEVTQEEADALIKRGITPVIVEPIVESQAELQYEGSKDENE